MPSLVFTGILTFTSIDIFIVANCYIYFTPSQYYLHASSCYRLISFHSALELLTNSTCLTLNLGWSLELKVMKLSITVTYILCLYIRWTLVIVWLSINLQLRSYYSWVILTVWLVSNLVFAFYWVVAHLILMLIELSMRTYLIYFDSFPGFSGLHVLLGTELLRSSLRMLYSPPHNTCLYLHLLYYCLLFDCIQ